MGYLLVVAPAVTFHESPQAIYPLKPDVPLFIVELFVVLVRVTVPPLPLIVTVTLQAL